MKYNLVENISLKENYVRIAFNALSTYTALVTEKVKLIDCDLVTFDSCQIC